MSDKLDPLAKSSMAAHEVVLELIKAGKLSYIEDINASFTQLLDHYRSELKRVRKENEAQ